MSISMDVFCSKCDDFMCDEDTYLCDCCGDPFHKKCMNLPSNKMNVMQLKMQRVFLFCNECLLSFNRVQRLLKCFEFDESNLQELKSPNSMLKKQYFDLKTKLEALETRLSTTAQPDERTNATKLPNPFENEEIISEMSNIDFEPNEVRVNNCRKIKLEKDIIVQEGKVDIVSNEKRQTYIEMQKGSVVPEVKMDFVSSEEHQTHIESAYLSSSSSTKKASTPKPKKTVSPKVLSPKIASPKVEPPPSKPLSPKIGSPRVNLTKLDISEEGKNLKSSKTINAATTKGTNTTADSGSEGKAQKASTLKVKIGAKAKTEKKVAPSAKQVTASSEEDTPMPAKKVTPRKPVKLAQKPVTSESSIKPAPTPKKRTLKLNNITNTSSEKSNESHFMENYLQNLSYGYNTLLYVFQYLKVQDLLRAGCVCTMWKDIASHPLLWRTVRMKNSQVHSFEGLANTLQKHGTVQLDLRKMLLTNCDEVWPEFSNNIGKVDTLRKIELCRCPAFVVERLTETNPKLEVVNAVTIRCEKMNLAGLANWTNLRELRLKSTTGLTLESDIESLRSLVSLKSLSLTSIKDLNNMKLDVISDLSNLESLDLGECTDFPKNFGKDILSKLKKLEKLRLEKGQGSCHTFEMLDAVKDMQQLEQLELVNFDIKAGFDKALGACKNIKKLLIIPTYISQSATTNHMVLGGVLRLQKSLSHFVWGVTLELLRVTELFVDQCEEPEKKEKKEKKVIGNGDSIPVLKPVPLITDDKSEIPPALDPPQVEILALPGLQKLLLQSLPTTRVKILKIPFHATWRQSITDAVN